MVSAELYLAFILATALLIAIPGPNVTLIIAHSVGHGARRAMMTVLGTQLAQAAQLAFVILGMTTLIALFAAVFEWLRWAGVVYLVWLGMQHWRAQPETPDGTRTAAPRRVGGRRLFWQGALVAATNPKTWLFYAAFFPQFVDPTRPLGTQLLILSATYLAIATALDSGYALIAGRMGRWLRETARERVLGRITGTLLIGAGVWLATLRRA